MRPFAACAPLPGLTVWKSLLLACVLSACCFRLSEAAGATSSAKPADLVLHQGAVYTLDAARSWAEAVAIRKGRIVYVGSEAGLEPWIGRKTKVVDLRGKMLLPGFHDSHTHPLEGGMLLNQCRLFDATNQQQVLNLIEDYARKNPHVTWIMGGGWQLPIFPNASPNKALLDRVVPDRPVYLTSADSHSVWVNSRALQLASIGRDTPNPPMGTIDRDPVTQEPTGVLREGAKLLLETCLPRPTQQDRVEGLRRGVRLANSFGITSVQEARALPEYIEAYKSLEQRRELTVRVTAALAVNSTNGVAQIPVLVKLRRKYQDRLLRPTAAKLFADGVIESGSAPPCWSRISERTTPAAQTSWILISSSSSS